MSEASNDLIAAIQASDSVAVRALLEGDPGLAAKRDSQGVSVLMLARYRGDRTVSDAVRVAHGPLDVFEAAAFGETDRLRDLLSGDASLARAWSPDGFTALHFAAFFGGTDVAGPLLEAGADTDAVSRNEMRVAPLHSAAAGRRGVAHLLLERGADPNPRQRHGFTPLHAAAERGDAELAIALLAAGADPTATNDAGETPAQRAAANNRPALVVRLERAAREHGAG